MKCFNCNTELRNDAKFCNNCGAATSNAQSGVRGNVKIILTEKNLADIHNLFFRRIRAYRKLLNTKTDPYDLLYKFNSKTIKSDVVDSMDDISKYILQFIDEEQVLQINFVNRIIAKFLGEDTSYFYQLLERIDILKQKYEVDGEEYSRWEADRRGCSLFILAAILGGIIGSVILPVIGTFLGVIIGLILASSGRSSAKEEKRDILSSRIDEFQRIFGAYNDLWKVFKVDILLNDIVQNTDIDFRIDNQRYEAIIKNEQ